jgi:hypothetical protein
MSSNTKSARMAVSKVVHKIGDKFYKSENIFISKFRGIAFKI